jgi:hypothetical protein
MWLIIVMHEVAHASFTTIELVAAQPDGNRCELTKDLGIIFGDVLIPWILLHLPTNDVRPVDLVLP